MKRRLRKDAFNFLLQIEVKSIAVRNKLKIPFIHSRRFNFVGICKVEISKSIIEDITFSEGVKLQYLNL